MAVTKEGTTSSSKGRWSELAPELRLRLSEVVRVRASVGAGKDFSWHSCLLFSSSALNQE